MSIKKEDNPQAADETALTGDTYMYPPADDMYNRLEEEEDIDPENTTQPKAINQGQEAVVPTDEQHPENDLDVPGAELDDEMEITGGEDEENNYYSLGHDNHEQFEEREGA